MRRDDRGGLLALAACGAAWLVPNPAYANDGLGALGDTVWAFGVAGVTGCGPIVLLVLSLFLYKWVRARSQSFRRAWPWAVIAISVIAQAAVITVTLIATSGTRHQESAGHLAATVCGLVMLFLSIVAVLAAFRAARELPPPPTEPETR